MTQNSEGTTGDLATDLAVLRQDVARLADTISGLVQHQTQAAGNRVSEAVNDAQNRVRAANGAIEACIGRNPLTSVLIALGVGMSLGLLSRSRS